MSSPRISIHIVCRDRLTELCMLLVSLRSNTYKEWDLVLVDGSNPQPLTAFKPFLDTVMRLKMDGHGVKIVRDVPPAGVCQARNLAIKEDHFNNPLVLRLDDDSVLENNYIMRLVQTMEQHGADITSGVVPLWGAPEGFRNPDLLKGVVDDVRFSEDGSFVMDDDCGCSYYPDYAVLPAKHARSNFLIKREVLDALGPEVYCERYGKVGFREETDFCMRARLAGFKRIYVDLGAKAWHQWTASGGVRSPDYALQCQIGDDLFKKRMKGWFKEHGDFLKEEEVVVNAN